jgi:glycolate oxidase
MTTAHRPRSDGDAAELIARELGEDRVLRPGAARLADYARDESGLGPYPPDCVVLCRSAAEVSAVLRLARERRIPVTPRGAGSGKTGGALPVRGGIVLSAEPMARILEIDEDDLVAVVEPGVILGDLQAAVEERGLFYPPDPASLAVCSIGGNVATNAGGPRAFKYGVTREYVLGLEVALMGGELLRCGRRTAKGVTGYDLVAGFVGSEGTFGVTTEIVLKLVPLPPAVTALVAVFRSMGDAGRAVSALLRAGFRPRTLELLDRTCLDHIRPAARFALPRDAGALALVELDGEPEGLEAAMVRAGQTCERSGATEVSVAVSERERRELWQARRSTSRALRDGFAFKLSEDICVPRGSLPAMLERIQGLGARHELTVASYGHAGDGNLHVNFLSEEPSGSPGLAARVNAAVRELFEHTIALRGTLSGEHGIGLGKRDFIPLEQPPRLIEWQRRWKAMWDPDALLNPGKVLPEPGETGITPGGPCRE